MDWTRPFTGSSGKQRIQEVRPGEFCEETLVVSPLQVATSFQRFFIATSDRLSASMGNSVRMTIANPADSGRKVVVVQVYSSIEDARYVYPAVTINPTTGLPAGVRTPFNTVVGSAVAASAVVKIDVGAALGGGTPTHLVVPFSGPGLDRHDIPGGIIIPPGVTLGLNAPLGALSAGNGSFGVFFMELDVADQ